LIGGSRRRSGTTRARAVDEGVDTEGDDEEQVSFAAAGADRIGRRTAGAVRAGGGSEVCASVWPSFGRRSTAGAWTTVARELIGTRSSL
jgi:hypothetical protein